MVFPPTGSPEPRGRPGSTLPPGNAQRSPGPSVAASGVRGLKCVAGRPAPPVAGVGPVPRSGEGSSRVRKRGGGGQRSCGSAAPAGAGAGRRHVDGHRSGGDPGCVGRSVGSHVCVTPAAGSSSHAETEAERYQRCHGIHEIMCLSHRPNYLNAKIEGQPVAVQEDAARQFPQRKALIRSSVNSTEVGDGDVTLTCNFPMPSDGVTGDEISALDLVQSGPPA